MPVDFFQESSFLSDSFTNGVDGGDDIDSIPGELFPRKPERFEAFLEECRLDGFGEFVVVQHCREVAKVKRLNVPAVGLVGKGLRVVAET